MNDGDKETNDGGDADPLDTGFLRPADRKYLLTSNPYDYHEEFPGLSEGALPDILREPDKAAIRSDDTLSDLLAGDQPEYNRRQEIRDRTLGAFADFTILLRHLSKRDRLMIMDHSLFPAKHFGEPSQAEGMNLGPIRQKYKEDQPKVRFRERDLLKDIEDDRQASAVAGIVDMMGFLMLCIYEACESIDDSPEAVIEDLLLIALQTAESVSDTEEVTTSVRLTRETARVSSLLERWEADDDGDREDEPTEISPGEVAALVRTGYLSRAEVVRNSPERSGDTEPRYL